jgi:hypothetical protein
MAKGPASATSGAPAAHSIVEERLFLLTVRCECGGGPLQKVSQTLAREGAQTIDLVRARCPRCALEREFRFDVSSFFGRFYPRRGVSDTAEPSQLLDAVAWVRWGRLYFRAFEGERAGVSGEDRADCGILSLRCLDEALKLFPPGEPRLRDGDLHTQGSREAFRAGPDRYARYELMGLQLEIAMMLASSGIDPDGGDPGIAHQGLIRLVEAVKRSAKSERTTTPVVETVLELPPPQPSRAPAALPGPAGGPLLLPAPAPEAASPWSLLARVATGAAILAALAAAAYAVASALHR